MRNLLTLAAALCISGPAGADCTFGGSCGDGSPYDSWVQQRGDRDWSYRNEGLDPPSYDRDSRDSGYGYRSQSYGSHHSDDDDE